MKIGSHVGMRGKEMMLGSVKEALSYDATRGRSVGADAGK